MNRIVQATPWDLCKGVFWWAPAATGGLSGRGFFGHDGNALQVMTVFGKYTRH
ncbi:MAG: hypothetical protein ABI165_11840 [Bryobacteraceae bacterium]